MTRDFLKNLGLDGEAIDRILDENMADIGKEKRKTEAAEAKTATANEALADAQGKLAAAQGELETLKASNGDNAKVQQQLSELQVKYDTDTGDLRGQIEKRDYSSAIEKAIIDKNLKFSSKSARSAFIAALHEKKLELKDGALDGLDDFIKTQKEADPDAFAPDKAPPRFATGSGSGSGGHGAPPKPTSRAAELAAQYQQNQYGTPKE